MRTARKLPYYLSAIMLACTAGLSPASAVELLTNGNLEVVNVPPVWSLSETVTGMPTASTNAAEIEAFANQPGTAAGQSGLWLRAFAGNQNGLTNQRINAVLSQTVPGTVGEQYTFRGFSKWEQNYSGGVDTLDATAPSGAIPSPTQTMLELTFLNASNAVIGSPVMLDLRSPLVNGGQIADNTWRQHTLNGMAPVGTTSVRVTATASDMIFNTDPSQSAFFDNFSLTGASAPATEILGNNALNQPDSTPGWTLTKNPPAATTGVFISDNFANNTPGGISGLWLRPFIVGDAAISQTVAATPGANYTFSAAAKWEENYSGGTAGATQTTMELAFLDAGQAVIGTPTVLDLRLDGQTNDNMWHLRDVSSLAPENAVSVRVTAGATGMSATTGAQSAFFDDLSLMIDSPGGVPGDYNENNVVDAADYTIWRDNFGMNIALPNEGTDITTGMVTQEDYEFWKSNFGNGTPGSGAELATSVPEPNSLLLMGIALALTGSMRRNQSRSQSGRV